MSVKILLSQARKEAGGISINELARRMEVSPQHISKIESGKTNPSLNMLSKICEALGTEPGPVSWIVYTND